MRPCACVRVKNACICTDGEMDTDFNTTDTYTQRYVQERTHVRACVRMPVCVSTHTRTHTQTHTRITCITNKRDMSVYEQCVYKYAQMHAVDLGVDIHKHIRYRFASRHRRTRCVHTPPCILWRAQTDDDVHIYRSFMCIYTHTDTHTCIAYKRDMSA
jgi:hypothetical protein